MKYRTILTITGVFLAVFAIMAKYSWQFIPLYVAIALCLLLLIFNPRSKRKIISLTSVFFFTALTFILLYIFPIFQFENPTGSYQVGVRYGLIETNRAEIMTQDPNDYRQLYVKIWYPSESTEGYAMNPYIEGGTEAIDQLLGLAGLPPFLFYQLSRIESHGFTNAPIANGNFPLLTFSHGYGSWFGQNTSLAEELASRGFIIVSIGHAHQTIFTASGPDSFIQYPSVIPLNTDTAQVNSEDEFERIFDTKDPVKFDQLIFNYINSQPSVNKYLNYWSEDIVSAIDYSFSENKNDQSFLYDHIDTTVVGSFGMSFGGAASAQATIDDARIKGAINMDGFQYGTWVKDTVHVPIVFMEAASRSKSGFSMYAPFKNRNTSSTYNYLFEEAEHWNFTDVNLFSPVFKWVGLLGNVKGKFMMESMNSIVPDFFESIKQNKPFDYRKHLIEEKIVTPNH